MCVSELIVLEQWKGKLNSRKFYRHKIPSFYFRYAPFLLHSRNNKIIYVKFAGQQWIDLIFVLNSATTIVLNHGQNDEKYSCAKSCGFSDKRKDKSVIVNGDT